MAMEIDFLAVGDESKGGDAIALRFGNLHGGNSEQIVMVVDGGTRDSGERLVQHIRDQYDTDYVNCVVSTHPDSDHIVGLANVLEGLRVGELWINRPVRHSKAIEEAVRGGHLNGLPRWLRESVAQADTVESLANRKGIPIREAFYDGQPKFAYGGYEVYVLGPSESYYNDLAEEMRRDEDRTSATGGGVLRSVFEFAGNAATAVLESVHGETLTDEGKTSPANNSSVVLYLRTPDGDALLTADAGIPALKQVVTHADGLGIDLSACRFQQVPHHGSKRNIGPTLLDTLIGPRGSQRATISTYVSAPKKGRPKHPNNKVTNAYKRRGADVYTTEGTYLWFHLGSTPSRSGYGPVSPLEYDFTEEEE